MSPPQRLAELGAVLSAPTFSATGVGDYLHHLGERAGLGERDSEDAVLSAGRFRCGREIAVMVPTTHVIDKHGIGLFSHVGPGHDWPAHQAFLRDAVARAGR